MKVGYANIGGGMSADHLVSWLKDPEQDFDIIVIAEHLSPEPIFGAAYTQVFSSGVPNLTVYCRCSSYGRAYTLLKTPYYDPGGWTTRPAVPINVLDGLVIIGVHFKSGSAKKATAHWDALVSDTINTEYANSTVLVIGDFNQCSGDPGLGVNKTHDFLWLCSGGGLPSVSPLQPLDRAILLIPRYGFRSYRGAGLTGPVNATDHNHAALFVEIVPA